MVPPLLPRLACALTLLALASAQAAEPDAMELWLRGLDRSATRPPAVAANQPDELELLLQNRGLLRPPSGFVLPSGADKATEMVVAAMGFLGRPYTWGGSDWQTGFDCSGFVQAIHRQSAGVRLPRSAAEQAAATVAIDRSELMPGDLVFFNTAHREFSHVGIYVGDNRFIHAPTAGSAIRMADLRLDYWDSRFNGARRVPTLARAPANLALTAPLADTAR